MRTQPNSQLRLVLSLALLGLLLAACAPSVKVRTDSDPGVDLSKYSSYNFFSKMGIEEEGYSNLLGQHFRDAVFAQMNSRGFEQTSSPQLQVNVTISTDDKVRVNTYQDPYLYGGHYGGRGGYYGGGYGGGWGSPMYGGGGTRTTVHQYTQANVYIDLVDSQQHKMVWQGVATFTLTEKMQKDVRGAVNTTVGEIFDEFPVPAPQAQ
jgi:hypothetical protein